MNQGESDEKVTESPSDFENAAATELTELTEDGVRVTFPQVCVSLSFSLCMCVLNATM